MNRAACRSWKGTEPSGHREAAGRPWTAGRAARDNAFVTAAIFGLIGVVVGALINGVVTALAQRRTERSERRAATRLVASELDTWNSLALAAEARPPEQLPQLHNAEPILWQSNRSVLARSLRDDDWEAVASAYAHVDALVSVLVFERDGTLADWRSREAKRLFGQMVDPIGEARVVLARASGDEEDERRPPRRRPVAA
jgi:hypothetical protein